MIDARAPSFNARRYDATGIDKLVVVFATESGFNNNTEVVTHQAVDAMGKSVVEAVRAFAGQRKLFKVHFRNVTRPLPEGVLKGACTRPPPDSARMDN